MRIPVNEPLNVNVQLKRGIHPSLVESQPPLNEQKKSNRQACTLSYKFRKKYSDLFCLLFTTCLMHECSEKDGSHGL